VFVLQSADFQRLLRRDRELPCMGSNLLCFVQHNVTPNHRISVSDFVKNVFYLFHNVILSFFN
ncbi:hypothetical protein, partial [Phocaeicola sartorii]|uniref:hypothetical protein n=1 Tax=Phocaeicola sartorii TaxID=671267 RepID=UPI0025581D46